MSESRRSVPDWLVERLAAGELPEAKAADVRARLEAEAGAERLAQLERSNREILAAYPSAAVAREIERRLSRSLRVERRASRGFALPVLALGGLSAMALSFAALQASPPARPLGEEGSSSLVAGASGAPREMITEKGLSPQLAIYKDTPSGPVRLDPSSRVRGGDRLQVSYVAGDRRYGVIASIDAEGTTTLHLPERSGASPTLRREGETALPHAFELDDRPGFERFVFVSGDAPFTTASVLEALQPGAARPPELSWTEIVLHKESP